MALDIDKFNSISDLYEHVLPALKTRASELNRANFNKVLPLDIWNYCVECKWKNKSDLRIYELVDDILNTDYKKLIDRDENK